MPGAELSHFVPRRAFLLPDRPPYIRRVMVLPKILNRQSETAISCIPTKCCLKWTVGAGGTGFSMLALLGSMHSTMYTVNHDVLDSVALFVPHGSRASYLAGFTSPILHGLLAPPRLS